MKAGHQRWGNKHSKKGSHCCPPELGCSDRLKKKKKKSLNQNTSSCKGLWEQQSESTLLWDSARWGKSPWKTKSRWHLGTAHKGVLAIGTVLYPGLSAAQLLNAAYLSWVSYGKPMQIFFSVFCSRVLLQRRRLIPRSVDRSACFEPGISHPFGGRAWRQDTRWRTSLPLKQVTTLRVTSSTVKKGFGQFSEVDLLS